MALRSLCLAAVLAALAVSPNAANAMGQGRLLFVNPNSGAWALGGVDQVGHYQLEASGSSSLSLGNETNLLPVPGFALSYAATTGKGTAVFDTHGVVSFLRGFSFSANWSTIKTLGSFIFFYDGAHTAAAILTKPDGTTSQVYSSSGLSHWTNIQTTDNYIFFYNKSNGAVVTAELDAGGFYQSQSSTVGIGYTLVGSVGDDVILYNRTTGAWESGPILYTGSAFTDHYSLSSSDTSGAIGLGYSDSVQMNGHLLLYESSTGNAAIGHFRQSGGFSIDSQTNIGKYWTHLVNCGQYLALYGFGTGKLEIGFIAPNGTYHSTQDLTAGAGWWNVVSTKN